VTYGLDKNIQKLWLGPYILILSAIFLTLFQVASLSTSIGQARFYRILIFTLFKIIFKRTSREGLKIFCVLKYLYFDGLGLKFSIL
jgi:hypothetical protein